ncbi:ABC transporter ATP-binding protein [Marinilabilia rubra]|uniref:Phosphonate ABC transporter ATP-binding protein n=1 Tax=Marinilabilia rubra TaxID=2162893 RepID=A0A2U2B9X2_9BACT|nr:ABC transporter ATP-binding protein [Marinilabilia rubra]PWD99870.1 phosphonate ABC transporter ATP-binding protein [Marinilabilia rubra]
MIHTRNIQKVYQRGEHARQALQNINIDIEEGEYVVVSGPSGSGKTTLLGLLSLVDVPSGGEIYFKGTEVAHMSESRRNKLRRKHIAVVFEHIHLIDELTVFENIEMPLLYISYSRKKRRRIVEELMERFRLTHLRRQYPGRLDDFIQQKIALARACSSSPDVIFADEPTGRLNSTESDEFLDLFRELNEAGQTIVMATHSSDAARHGQRIIPLYDGHVVSRVTEPG